MEFAAQARWFLLEAVGALLLLLVLLGLAVWLADRDSRKLR